VWQKTLVAIRPEVRVKRVAPFLGAELDDHPPLPFQALFQQLRQHTLERLTLEVVEEDFGHGFSAGQGRRLV
jgi:hypothetical protein